MNSKDVIVEESVTRVKTTKAAKITAAISVIIPVQNMESEIEEIYGLVASAMNDHGKSFEIVFIDDGSTDSTYAKLLTISSKDKQVKLIRMRSAFGESSAFDAGIKNSTGDVIVYFTARVRINPAGIPKLLERLDDQHDLVVGWRYPRRDSGLNQVISKMFNSITGKLAKLELHDMNSGILVTKRDVLENINLYGDFHNFIPVLAVTQGYRVTEEKIEQLKGKFRRSMYVREYLQRMLDIITVLFLTNYLKKPIHALGFVGSLFTLLGAVIELYLFVYRILGLGPIAGRPLLLLGAMLLVIGIQMISIGLLGEMIIFTHARELKEYNIEEIIETKA
ncbi:glycosyltransferase [candidate division KSB1 bacterium]|nr:glycosyltransferase [candidate division KSB1 bacterium]